MTHYRQILVNISVEDNASEKVMEIIKDKIEECVKDEIGKNNIKNIEVKVN